MLEILVTGADGQLGRSLRHLGAAGANRYTFTDVAELDITDADAVRRQFGEHRYDVVINCAAYTNVERADAEEEAADRLNRLAVRHLAEAAAAAGATLIHISTDYVFDGHASTPYTEEAAPGPLNAYGRTKLAGEEEIAATGCRALIFRTAWLYSEFGGNFLKTMLRLTAEKEHINVVADQIGTPTYARDLAAAIFAILKQGIVPGIYHFSNEGVISWYDFTKAIHRIAGITDCKVRPLHTEEYPTPAARPHYSVLDKTKIKETYHIEIPYWEDSLEECIRQLEQA